MRLPANVVQSVLVAVLLAVAGAAWSTYMTAHDTARDVAALQGKVEWLYRYTVPAGEHGP